MANGKNELITNFVSAVSNTIEMFEQIYLSFVEKNILNFHFQNSTELLSLPDTYVSIRRYFVIVANCLSIVLLALGILILLTNR